MIAKTYYLQDRGFVEVYTTDFYYSPCIRNRTSSKESVGHVWHTKLKEVAHINLTRGADGIVVYIQREHPFFNLDLLSLVVTPNTTKVAQKIAEAFKKTIDHLIP